MAEPCGAELLITFYAFFFQTLSWAKTMVLKTQWFNIFNRYDFNNNIFAVWKNTIFQYLQPQKITSDDAQCVKRQPITDPSSDLPQV